MMRGIGGKKLNQNEKDTINTQHIFICPLPGCGNLRFFFLWIIDTSHKSDREGVTIWANDVIIADVVEDQHGNSEANAKRIVTAVNCHDDMLAALQDSLATLYRWQDSDEWDERDELTLHNIKAAIAKATNNQ